MDRTGQLVDMANSKIIKGDPVDWAALLIAGGATAAALKGSGIGGGGPPPPPPPPPQTANVQVSVESSGVSPRAIAGATVTLGSATLTTGSNGIVTFLSVPYGNYTLAASASGFQSSSQTVTINSPIPSFPIALTAISPTLDTITVVVLDNVTSNPITNATVAFADTTGHTFNGTLSGTSYTITSIPDRDVGTVNAGAPNYIPATQNIASVTNGMSVTIRLSQQVSGVTTLSGTVVNGNTNALLSGILITLGPQSTTSLSGSYSLSNVPAGSQIIIASGVGYHTQSVQVTILNHEANTLNFRMVPVAVTTFSVSVALLRASTDALYTLAAVVRLQGGSYNSALNTGGTGHVTFANVPGGNYTITVTYGTRTTSQSVTVASGSTSFAITLPGT